MAWSLRRAEAADVPAALALVQRGFEFYRSFGPPGWQPPDETRLIDRTRTELERPDTVSLIAEVGQPGRPLVPPDEVGQPGRPLVPPDEVGQPGRPLVPPVEVGQPGRPVVPPVGFVHMVTPDDPYEFRFRYLFVDESHWGTGLARELHGLAMEALGDRSARLVTPERQARARRFYEREGWRLVGHDAESDFGMPLVSYARG